MPLPANVSPGSCPISAERLTPSLKAHFASAPDLLVQLIVSMPALLIIITYIFFLQLVRRVRTRTIATIGLLIYVAAGAGCFFVDEIHVLLLMRALLGVSVGLIMPLVDFARR